MVFSPPVRQPESGGVRSGDGDAPAVLVGEPDERTARLIAHRLAGLGCVVEHVEDGHEVEAALAKGAYAVVLLDLRMPGVPGLELLRRIRRSEKHGRTPVVVLSATDNERDLERAFALGASEYIEKPFSPKELVARVRRLLPPSGGTAA